MTDVIVNANLTFLMTKKFEPKFILQVGKGLALIIRSNPRWRNEELTFFYEKTRFFGHFKNAKSHYFGVSAAITLQFGQYMPLTSLRVRAKFRRNQTLHCGKIIFLLKNHIFAYIL